MTITIVSNHVGDGEVFVHAVAGALSEEQRVRLAGLTFGDTPREDEQVAFAVVEVCGTLEEVAGRLADYDRNGRVDAFEPEVLEGA
jgi:hypothetical protein